MWKIVEIRWVKLPDGRVIADEVKASTRHNYLFQTKDSAIEYLKGLGNVKLHEFAAIDTDEAKKIIEG